LTRTTQHALAVAWTLLAALAASDASAEQRVVAVRHWTAPDHTRVVVDLTDTPDYSTRVLTAPDRIVVFIQSCRIAGAPEPPPVGDGIVEQVRLNQLEQGAQIVIDLARASAHNVFALKPYDGKPNRVVIDVFREGSAAAATPAPAPAAAPASASAPRPVTRHTIVIDAGHGGEDPGATGSGKLVEKDIVLDITKRLGAALETRPGFEVRYTRTGDYGVSLGRRRQIASQGDCDLFVSVHANSAPNKDASGTEVFFLSPRGASDQKARELADRENAADLVGGVSPDADRDVLSILVDLKATDSIEKSADLGEMISTELERCDLGECSVKQAGFVVLKSLEMPSVLVEVGFLTSKADRKKLGDSKYREEYAVCLADAIQAYFERYQPAAAVGGRHRVAPGETLWSIARRYGMSVEELRRVNHLSEDATIRVDQILVVRGA
jgi:N-acetylmuramoyl-L-alanine amidase